MCGFVVGLISSINVKKKNGWTIKTTTSCVRIVGTVAATQISLEDKKLTSFHALDTCFLVELTSKDFVCITNYVEYNCCSCLFFLYLACVVSEWMSDLLLLLVFVKTFRIDNAKPC